MIQAIKKILLSPLSALVTLAVIACLRAEAMGYTNVAETIALVLSGLGIVLLSMRTYLGLSFGVIAVIAIVPVAWWMYGEFTALVDSTAILGSLALIYLHCRLVEEVNNFLQARKNKK